MFEKLLLKLIGARPSAIGLPLPSVEDAEPLEAIDDAAIRQQSAYDESRRIEKERIRQILASEETQGRTRQAVHLATSTDLTPEVVIAILAVSGREVTNGAPKDSGQPTAKEQATARHNDFFERHQKDNPELWNAQPPLSVAETVSRIAQNYALATGDPKIPAGLKQ
jgi:hypothetical protein